MSLEVNGSKISPPLNTKIHSKLHKYKPSNREQIHSKSSNSIIRMLSNYFGKEIGKMILTISKTKKEDAVKQLAKKNDLIETGFGGEITINKADSDVSIKAFSIKPNCPDKPLSDKWIVVFNGMGDLSDNHIEALEKLANDTNANVISFDYRGVGTSGGKAVCMDDLVEDGTMVLDYLKDVQVDPKNILLYGHSMGGGVAAKLHGESNHPGPLLSESSFSTFATAISKKKNRFVAFFVKLFNWDLDATKFFESTKGKGIIVNRRDPTVPYSEASLYKKLTRTALPETTIKRVKIGTKHEKEEMETTQVKSGTKRVSNKRNAKAGSRPNSKAVEKNQFKRNIDTLKRKRVIKLLQHPHERIMDRVIHHEKITLTAEQNKIQELRDLRTKFYKEDQRAYTAIVNLIGELWTDLEPSPSKSGNK